MHLQHARASFRNSGNLNQRRYTFHFTYRKKVATRMSSATSVIVLLTGEDKRSVQIECTSCLSLAFVLWRTMNFHSRRALKVSFNITQLLNGIHMNVFLDNPDAF